MLTITPAVYSASVPAATFTPCSTSTQLVLTNPDAATAERIMYIRCCIFYRQMFSSKLKYASHQGWDATPAQSIKETPAQSL